MPSLQTTHPPPTGWFVLSNCDGIVLNYLIIFYVAVFLKKGSGSSERGSGEDWEGQREGEQPGNIVGEKNLCLVKGGERIHKDQSRRYEMKN